MPNRYIKELGALTSMLSVFREIDPDGQLQVQTVQTFLLVAAKPGCSQQYLCDQTGLSQSSVSRNLQTLSEWHRVGKRGLNLIEAVTDPADTRKKCLFLTPRGKEVAQRVLMFQTGNASIDLDVPTAKQFVTGVRRAAMG